MITLSVFFFEPLSNRTAGLLSSTEYALGRPWTFDGTHMSVVLFAGKLAPSLRRDHHALPVAK